MGDKKLKEYIRLSENYGTNKLIPINVSPYTYVKNLNKPYFISMMKYNHAQFEQWQKTNSLAGMKGGNTNKIWVDFDSKDNLELAFKEAHEFCQKLLALGFVESNLEISFSGGKGVGIIINNEAEYTIEQVKNFCTKLSQGMTTFDSSMYDHQRIFRLLFTKNEKTGLYKIPISLSELENPDISDIKDVAANLDNFDQEAVFESYTVANVTIPDNLLNPPEIKKEPVKVKTTSLNMTDKPRHWADYKWALMQGHFEKGERHNALMVCAATCRGLGYDESLTSSMLHSVDEKHCVLTGDTPTDDIEDNIIPSVFSPHWTGGQYSVDKNPWLQKYCERMGFDQNASDETPVIAITDAYAMFKDYAKNIDELTIKSGIPALDKKLRMTIGMVVGIVAGPGVGKTSIALQMLNNMSKLDQQCVFFSYDMYHALVFQKLVQKHLHIQPEEIFDRFKKGDPELEKSVMETLSKEYQNVEFCFKTGQTPSDIIKTIKFTEQKTGRKVRFIVIDYNELVMSDMNDATAASASVAHKLREIANSLNICVLTLLQPNKMSGTPSDEILSYRATKGSSVIEQTMSVMLGMSRPGYDPHKPENDKFVTINAVKVRMGPLFSVDLHWDGVTGSVRELVFDEKQHLKRLRDEKQAEKEAAQGGGEWS